MVRKHSKFQRLIALYRSQCSRFFVIVCERLKKKVRHGTKSLWQEQVKDQILSRHCSMPLSNISWFKLISPDAPNACQL